MIAKDFIDPYMLKKETLKGFEKDYASILSLLMLIFWSISQAWIKNGKKESPQEMTDFLLRIYSTIK